MGLRRIYAALLHLYPRAYRKRFGRELEQLFAATMQDQRAAGANPARTAIWLFADTLRGVLRENRRIATVLVLIALLLCVPAIAMQFSDEVVWTPFDFLAAGALLVSASLIFETVARRVKRTRRRLLVAAVVAGAVLATWIDLAAGIVGNDPHPPLLAAIWVGVALVLAAGRRFSNNFT